MSCPFLHSQGGGGVGGGGVGGGGVGGGGEGNGGGGDGCAAQTRSSVALQSDTTNVFGAEQTVHSSQLRSPVPAPQGESSYCVFEQTVHAVHSRLLVAPSPLQGWVIYCVAAQIVHAVHSVSV